jgi:hypothetical protein
MAKLTKADAARQLGISRTTLYKLIDQGKVSATPEGLIDQTELVRAAPYVDILKERSRTSTKEPSQTPMYNTVMDTSQSQGEHDTPTMNTGYEHVNTARERTWTDAHEREQTSTTSDLVHTLLRQVEAMRHALQAELEAARQERQAALQERQEAREERALLVQMLHEAQHRYDRLLEAPRPAPLSPAGAGNRTAADVPRGEMRRRIVALLREHPEGLSPVQTRQLLSLEKDLGSTMKAMVRDGLLRRIAQGRYVL